MTRGWKLILLGGLVLLNLFAGQNFLTPVAEAQTVTSGVSVWGWGSNSSGQLCNVTTGIAYSATNLGIANVK